MPKISALSAARDAQRADKRMRDQLLKKSAAAALPDGSGTFPIGTQDSFVNFQHKMGVGADNPLTTGSYGFNPITRNRTLLEWIHRGSWLGGIAVDIIADDMTRAGSEFTNEMDPSDGENLEQRVTSMHLWESAAETIQWGRLYGGAICVALIDGQDLKTPLRAETVGPGQFKGVLVLDRWMVEPSVNNLVQEYGPDLGMPKFYRVTTNAPALRNQTIHYSRVLIRHDGVKVPYQQRLTENLWGISVLERLYDRMISFDSASTGAAQLVYKAYLRTVSVKDMRGVIAQGGPALDGLVRYVEMMRRFQSIEGITLIDGEDKLEVQGHQAFSGLAEVVQMFGEQISGALQIPLTRLFGRSPGGLNSTGQSDERTYYDGIKQQQMRTLHRGMTMMYKLTALSEGIKLPDNFALAFRSLWQLNDQEKADAADKIGKTVGDAYTNGLIGRQTALKELRQASRTVAIFSNITAEDIESADNETGPPPGALEQAQIEGQLGSEEQRLKNETESHALNLQLTQRQLDEPVEPRPKTKDRRRVIIDF